MEKSYVDVIIDNKVLTLGGKEKEAYYQQVAAYVNDKIGELRSEPGFNRQPKDIQNILIYLNIADDYLKSKARFEEVCALVDKQAKDVYKFKHDLVADKLRIEKLEKELAAAQSELAALKPEAYPLYTAESFGEDGVQNQEAGTKRTVRRRSTKSKTETE